MEDYESLVIIDRRHMLREKTKIYMFIQSQQMSRMLYNSNDRYAAIFIQMSPGSDLTSYSDKFKYIHSCLN